MDRQKQKNCKNANKPLLQRYIIHTNALQNCLQIYELYIARMKAKM